ncbi:hypothetical protein A0R60_0870 [Enterobacter asburiae]|nr:hypothetical protein A0R60_0870 [Enterobacter asburiae]
MNIHKRCHRYIMSIVNLFTFAMVMLLSSGSATATIMGFSIDNNCGLPRSYSYDAQEHSLRQGYCSIKLASTFYVPVSGYYTIGARGVDSSGNIDCWAVFSSYINATQPLNSQDINPGTNGGSRVCGWQPRSSWDACDVLKGTDGKIYYLNTIGRCTGQILPPTPVVNTSCSINSGNALNVSLGSLDRATLPTTPSSGSANHIKIPVSCTGGDVTVSMNITYTAITIGSTQAVKTSANGVGTAIIYNNAAVSPTSKATINLKSGSNTVDLGFQAIRDSAVAVKDIPTGAFTASAVMVMTQQ